MKVIAALLLLLLAASPAAAQTNPFTGAPAPAPAAEPAQPPGFFARINREIARFQRDTTREMSTRMRAIRDGETPMALLVGIGLAFLYGVIHAAGPGHGKAVVVGYFLTRQARIGRGLLMGLQISVGHVISAIVIALVADLVFRTVWGTAATEIRMIQLASYALIAIIGVYMIVEAARGGGHHHHEHCTVSGHDHSHDPHGHSHHREHRPQGWLSLGVGIVPCTGAILVMLYALANGILFAGFVLVAAIAAGMALTMAGLGVLAIVARNAMTRWTSRRDGESSDGFLSGIFDYTGGVVITLIGAFLFWGAY